MNEEYQQLRMLCASIISDLHHLPLKYKLEVISRAGELARFSMALRQQYQIKQQTRARAMAYRCPNPVSMEETIK